MLQCDVDVWETWNATLVKQLEASQAKDGSFSLSPHGPPVDTPLTLLALAVNYKFLPVYER